MSIFGATCASRVYDEYEPKSRAGLRFDTTIDKFSVNLLHDLFATNIVI